MKYYQAKYYSVFNNKKELINNIVNLFINNKINNLYVIIALNKLIKL